MSETFREWRFERYEKLALITAFASLLIFGMHIERRTALRRSLRFTDLGVYTRAAWAVRSGENLYTVSDSNGLHYNYPPALAILFTPLACPPWRDPATLPPEEQRTDANTPWGYDIAGHNQFYGLHGENFRFFCIVWIWYGISVVLEFLSVHLLASTLEGRKWTTGPPIESGRRWRWWALRAIPLVACIASVDMDLSRGQTDLVMLAGISVALYLAARNREITAGTFLALPAAIKFFPIVLLAYPIWHRRRRMMLGYVLGLLLFFALLPIGTFGLDRTIELYRTWTNVLVKPGLGHGIEATRAKELGMTATDNQSLLALIHNWQYYNLPRDQRPPDAAASARFAAYLISALTILGIGIVSVRRPDSSPQKSLLVVGVLIGWSFILSPVVRNAYFLLLLPLLTALVDHRLPNRICHFRDLRVPPAVVFFMVTDMLVRVPGIGGWLRDLGLPLLSVIWLMGAGAAVLFGEPASEVSEYSQLQV